jgi:hypothetical protein
VRLHPDLEAKCLELAGERPAKPSPKSNPRQKLKADPQWNVPDDMLNGIESSITVVMQAKTQCKNAREHYAVKAKRVAAEHAELQILLSAHTLKRERLAKGCRVKMTRIGKRVDDDNLQGYLANVRDYVAFWLLGGRMGQMDSDPRIEWVPDQKYLGPKSFGVVVSMEIRET